MSESQTRPFPAPVPGRPPTEPAGWVVAGRYRLRRLLGQGGMGAVWLADDQALRRPVAAKQPLHRGLEADGEHVAAARARLRREARLAARVNHPATVRVYDLTEEAGDPWIVMEALAGRTLEETLRQHGPLPVGQVTHLGLRLLGALQATHRAGVVHRDVKPGNVQLCGAGRVVLTDFGIAAASDDPGALTGKLVGSPAYMSPEQVDGGRFGPASDLFSLGATLYAAVEGSSPFGKGCPVATLTAVVGDPPAPLRRAGPLGPVIQGLLAKDPERRPDPEQARSALQLIQHA